MQYIPNISFRSGFSHFLRLFQMDARHIQMLFLGSFLILGIMMLEWDVDMPRFALNILTCVSVQLVLAWWFGMPFSSWKSALISALGLCILLKTNTLETTVIASFLTIASKFFIRVKNKHVFNPTNFGIIASILITGDAWVSPGQWGSNLIVLFFIGTAALLILLKVGRLDVSFTFILTFWGLKFAWIILYLGWPIDHFVHFMMNGTVLLFTFFMITDPMTTPNDKKARLIWTILLGILSFIFDHVFILQSAAPLWALFIISPMTPLFDKLFVARKFTWLAEA